MNKGDRPGKNQTPKPSAKMRVDALLVARGLAGDLKEAQALVMAGQVVAGEQRVDKPAKLVASDTSLRVKDQRRFVSRGGDKLAGAITALGLQGAFAGQTALDVGASTGGFTECLLSLGVQTVIALDVGHNQLAWSLRQNPQVVVCERTDIRDFNPQAYPRIDWIVADVSFTSLTRLATALVAAGSRDCRYLVMVKPQFELPSAAIPSGGVVTDENLQAQAVEKVSAEFVDLGLSIYASVHSPLKGRSGNQEIFLYMGWPPAAP